MNMVKTARLVILFSLITFLGTAQTKPEKYQGLLWEITGENLKAPSYLYGTMHVSSKLAFHLIDTFFVALNNVDVIALESDPTTWLHTLDDYKHRGNSYFGGFYNYSNLYSDAFYFESPEKKFYSRALSFENRMNNPLLYRGNERNKDFEEKTYLDMFVYQSGMKLGKEILSLENVDDVMVLRIKGRKVNKEEEEEYGSRYSYGAYDDIEEAYRSGDLDLIDSLITLIHRGTYFKKYMLDIRNEGMVANMDSVIKSGKSIFSGVGAAHLPGEMGMIDMLRE